MSTIDKTNKADFTAWLAQQANPDYFSDSNKKYTLGRYYRGTINHDDGTMQNECGWMLHEAGSGGKWSYGHCIQIPVEFGNVLNSAWPKNRYGKHIGMRSVARLIKDMGMDVEIKQLIDAAQIARAKAIRNNQRENVRQAAAVLLGRLNAVADLDLADAALLEKLNALAMIANEV